MADTEKNANKKNAAKENIFVRAWKKIKAFCKGLKAEFKKIIWPNKETLAKQTAVTIVISLILCLVIALIDMLSKYGVQFLVNL